MEQQSAWEIGNIATERAYRSQVVAVPKGAPTWFSQQGATSAPTFIVADQAVRDYAQTIYEALQNTGNLVQMCCLEITEARKSMDTVQRLYAEMVAAGLTRDSRLVAIGGGVLTDVAGFAAATYLRGIDWIAVPTTLLGQVDAAIGGKVAVNLPTGKNLVGAFHLPRWVVLDAGPLATLPVGEWKVGLGEIVKSGLIAGGWLWQRLNQPLPALGQVSPQWLEFIATTAAIKAEVVNRDPWEDHERMFLNFGHTLAHALEQLSGYGQLRHGEAVGLGSLAALYLSEQVLGLDPAVRSQVRQWLEQWEMPVQYRDISYDAVAPVLMRDKKARGFGLQWILLEDVGTPKIVTNVQPSLIAQALAMLGGHEASFGR